MTNRYNSFLGTVGNTTIGRFNKFAHGSIRLYSKLKGLSPLGSVGDRLALAFIEAAESRGELQHGQTVIKAANRNNGVALALACAQRGHPLVLIMSATTGQARRQILRALGARVVLTPACAASNSTLIKARELAAAHGWYLCRQFDTLLDEMDALELAIAQSTGSCRFEPPTIAAAA